MDASWFTVLTGEYHVNTSELVQLLLKGHRGVHLDAEAWNRIITWIDLNGPCHRTWGRAPIPDGVHVRRIELRRIYGGPRGAFFDRPQRCRSAFWLAYPPWQSVFNVGFRVVSEDPQAEEAGGSNL
ncbi:MAG TPA: hypothetical protein PK373_09880 [Sedimentisphaerales bacterium]|nr:hypothetical protein [Sedimentisphaerales bacterium]HQG49385.1 hypothetical protein [Sedimentisphaerales bacterium]HQI26683.1 hypothetical protein [Sedimentisphaerales bacterium]